MEYHCTFITIQKSALFKTRESHFLVVWVMELSIISLCLGKVKVFPIILACQSESTFNVCMKTLNEFCVLGINGLMFVCELSDCGINSLCSYLNLRYRACFEQGTPWHSGNYEECRVTLKRVFDMIRTHSWKVSCRSTVLENYFIRSIVKAS